jgi:TPR repeat protein
MKSLNQITLQTLENESETGQVDTFINHIRSILVMTDKNKSSISFSQFLESQSKKHPKFLEKYTSKLEEYLSSDDPILIDLLGSCISHGIGIKQDAKRSYKIFLKAADFNYHRGLFNLGLCYYLGQGVAVNRKKAIELFKKAAELGNPQAMFSLGVCYEKGAGAPKNMAKAIKYYTDVADRNEPKALSNLAL